ncbi:hypothetical protein FO519_000817 [Halicephalobus sp. NKZ332]|nr:hypothetical protein FO519_000817 [Halicephalobus sp. NKZ332]
MNFQEQKTMGCQNSKETDKFDHFDKQFEGLQSPTSNYLTLALLNANKAASLVASDLCPEELENGVAEQLIRRAKNDGQTVSVINNCLYLDYKFVGFMPSGVSV